MVHRPSPRHRCTPGRASTVLLALAVLCAVPALAPAQAVLRETIVIPGNAEPILLNADAVQTWAVNGRRVFLLHGNACVTQAATVVRMADAVAWVDEAGRSNTGAYDIELYGEGNFEIGNGATTRTAERAIVRLATRGQVDVKARNQEVQQTAPARDPVYQRAEAVRLTPVAPAAAAEMPFRAAPANIPVQLVQAQVPNPVVPGPPPAMPGLLPAAPPAVPPPPPVLLGPVDGTTPGAPEPTAASPKGPARNLTIRPRSTASGELVSKPLPGDETAYIYTGGIILTVSSLGDKKGTIDIEGDRLVVWRKTESKDAVEKLRGPQGVTTGSMEFYLAGNVVLRYQGMKGEAEILSADEVYYDVNRNVAIFVKAELEIRDPKLPYPLHMKAPTIYQTNAKTFEAGPSDVFSTILPSDPGLLIELKKTRVVERETVRTTIFGTPYRDPKTGGPLVETDRYFEAKNMFVWLEGVPVFYFPYYTGRVSDPLGPLEAISGNYNRIFGFQLFSTWDVFDLIGVRRPDGSRWRLYVDYLSARGPALGTQYDYTGLSLFGIPGKIENIAKAYGIKDHGTDIIGTGGTFAYVSATEIVPITHPDYRGRVFDRLNAQELPAGFSLQAQVSLISDRNFMEQYYFNEVANDLNQETFAYLRQQQNTWQWNLLVEDRVRNWVTETNWLPKAMGYLQGETLFDRVIYNARASAGYAQLLPTNQPPPPYLVTDTRTNTARVDVWQQLELPFAVGPFKIMPYVIADLTYYSSDVNDNQVGRLYGGGGLYANVPLSKLYPDVHNELLNLNGIYHKLTLSGNYFNAGSTTNHNNLPQLDRLYDDFTDFTLRQMHILNPIINPGNGTLVANSPVFNPQDYAIRRLVDNYTDTLDSIQTLNIDLRQRLQTKRGFPGSEHVVDWMSLDVSATLFPDSHRDDFGHLLGFVDYDWNWNIGDRTALFSTGWFEPFTNGSRVFAFGATFNRPDTTNFLISYRQLDPLNSRAVIGAVTFPFNAKYALTASTTWDFGAKNEYYSLLLTRKGTDVLVGLGISYNSILNNFGVTFEVVPNLLLSSMRPGAGLLGSTGTATGSGR